MTNDELLAWREKVATAKAVDLERSSVLSVIDELLQFRADRAQISAVLQDKIQETDPTAKRTYVIINKRFRWDGPNNQRILIEGQFSYSKRYSAHAPVTSVIKRHPNEYEGVIEYVEVEYKRISTEDWLTGNR